ncbi:unnamed protein product [Danaus chrysippus]|uniref:(African queen) hypothetical protein n=1 Tax=Danaus chrysippus TaxID=151541 RepID=A0A8J2QZ19_9NEOP|nr:unnamed protein product [Danaus chrysippus]
MASGGHPEGAALVTRHDQLAGSLARLQRLAASRQAALMESVCRAARQVALEQLIDWHCFLRDAKQMHALCAAQEAALG